jgi:hypothetical protein
MTRHLIVGMTLGYSRELVFAMDCPIRWSARLSLSGWFRPSYLRLTGS